MKISVTDNRWLTYIAEPDPQSYKGFRQKGTMKIETGEVTLTFTNGEKEFDVIGNSIKDAYIKVFDTIDSFEN